MVRRRVKNQCPHCFVDFEKCTEKQCGKCGRVYDGLRWCCLAKGRTFSAKKLGGGNLPFCPICETNRWVEGMFAELPIPGEGKGRRR